MVVIKDDAAREIVKSVPWYKRMFERATVGQGPYRYGNWAPMPTAKGEKVPPELEPVWKTLNADEKASVRRLLSAGVDPARIAGELK